jgi:hypothetical protein
MHKTRLEAIARIKQEVGTSPLLILEQDKRLQLTLAGWKFIEFFEDEAPDAKDLDGLSLPELIAVAWDGIGYMDAQIESVVGYDVSPRAVVQQAAKLGLGYPDGTIHHLAEQWIALKVQAMIQSRSKKKT